MSQVSTPTRTTPLNATYDAAALARLIGPHMGAIGAHMGAIGALTSISNDCPLLVPAKQASCRTVGSGPSAGFMKAVGQHPS